MTQIASEHLGESLGTDFFSVREQFTHEQRSHVITVRAVRRRGGHPGHRTVLGTGGDPVGVHPAAAPNSASWARTSRDTGARG
jgi:hypothetical protein